MQREKLLVMSNFIFLIKSSFIFEESEDRYKNQVLQLSLERDESRQEVSRLKDEVKDLNADIDGMIEDSEKVAKLSRKNTQDHWVSIFSNYCDEQGIPHPTFPLEVFSDDEQPVNREIISGGEERLLESEEEQKTGAKMVEEEESKDAFASTSSLGQPLNLDADTGAGLGGAGGEIPKTTITDGAPFQQQS